MRYWAGVLTGIAASAIGVLFFGTRWLLPRIVEQVPPLRDDEIPRLTGVVTGGVWAWGAPIALTVLLVLVTLLLRRRETALVAGLTVVTVASFATILFTLMGCYMPLSELAIQLRAGAP